MDKVDQATLSHWRTMAELQKRAIDHAMEHNPTLLSRRDIPTTLDIDMSPHQFLAILDRLERLERFIKTLEKTEGVEAPPP